MRQTLRRAGGSLIMTVQKAFVEQNSLSEGSQVELNLAGSTMTVEVKPKPRYKLADLLAEMPEGLPRLPEWESMPPSGEEVW